MRGPPRGSRGGRGSGGAEALGELGEAGDVGGVERGEGVDDALHVGWVGALDAGAPGIGERHDHVPAVAGVALAGDESVALEVVDDDGDVAARLQDLAAEVALVEWSEVPQRLEGPEAARREAVFRQRPMDAGVDGGERSRQLDVGVERASFGFAAAVAVGHVGLLRVRLARRA